MDLKTALYLAVQRHPDQEAIIEGNKKYTYTQWGERIYKLANSFRRIGIEKGDKIAIALKNHEQTVTAMMAIQIIGGIAVMCNPRSIADRIKYYLKDSDAKGIIFEKNTAKAANNALKDSPKCRLHISIDMDDLITENTIFFEQLIEDGSPEEPKDQIKENDVGIIIYTSGTTGEPKGVPITHKMSFHRAIANGISSGVNKEDSHKVIGLMPLFHTIGIHGSFIFSMLYDGTYFPVADFIPDDAISLIEQEKITHVFASPTHYHMILSSKKWQKKSGESIEYAMYAGAPMETSLIAKCCKEITEKFVHIYGSSEMYLMGCLQNCKKYPGAIKPTLFQNLRVIKFLGNHEDIVQYGEEGELIADLRCPEAFSGYLNKKEKTEKDCRHGWYYTGDVARLEAGPLIYVSGRADDMIISGAENIHPAEVEDVLLMHPDVSEAAVIGVPDERWGEVVMAFIVSSKASLRVEELDEFFKKNQKVENWKRPKKYKIIQALPKTESGKVQRFKLRK
jgi:2-furoate---CoA ligase